MSLEAIAALLGHRSMDMTLIYARISDDTVADAYFKVTEAVEAQYYGLSGAARPRPATSSAPTVSDHRRLLANGHCTRPALLDCAFESVCERCGFFETGPQFVTILKRQRKHANERARATAPTFSRASSKESPTPSECASIGDSQDQRITCITPGRGKL